MDFNFIINIDRLPREGLHLSRDFEFVNLDLVEETATILEPVHGDIFVRLVGEEIFVQGVITTRIRLMCARCLNQFDFPVASQFDLVYLPEELNMMTEELTEEEIERLYYRGREFDLKALVLEQLNLSFPAKPICSENCEGMCAVCGEVIHDGHCSCLVQTHDPRLDKLKIFIRDKR